MSSLADPEITIYDHYNRESLILTVVSSERSIELVSG